MANKLPPARFVRSVGPAALSFRIQVLTLIARSGFEVVHGRLWLGTEVSRAQEKLWCHPPRPSPFALQMVAAIPGADANEKQALSVLEHSRVAFLAMSLQCFIASADSGYPQIIRATCRCPLLSLS